MKLNWNVKVGCDTERSDFMLAIHRAHRKTLKLGTYCFILKGEEKSSRGSNK
jgi:hypothetical protein